ncbi:MAG TPA: TolC family protein [Kofleriaceae bacterium]|nr:TolC family protein [Kofleriaceae bacterium]
MNPKVILALAAVILSASPVAAAPLTLEDAVQQALVTSEDARSASARRAQAEAEVAVARSALFPSLTLNGSYTRRQNEVTRNVGGEDVTIQSHNALAGNVTVAATLFDGRAYPLLRAARHARDAAALDEQDRRRQIAYAAAASYLVALGQERVVDAAVRRQEFAVARRRDVSARVDARLVSTNDRTQADLEVATATREVAEARAQLELAYADLTWWIGADVSGPLVEPAGLMADARGTAPGLDTLAVDAQRQRPDLAAARQRIEAARETAKEPGRRVWPTLDLTGQYRFTNEGGLSGNNADWLVTLGATWELWDGGRRAAEGRVRAIDVELARIDSAAADRKSKSELRTALARLHGAQAALPPAEEVATAAARHTDEIAILYAQGLARALDVVDAGARRFDAEVEVTQARLDLAAAWLELSLAAGAPAPGGTK